MARPTPAVVVLVASLAVAGCARFGFTDRVLHEVPSPDGRFVAVCQEVPVLDGPDFKIRLHRPDGALVRILAFRGDGQRCDEVVWSQDATRLAIRAAARVTVVDIDYALRQPAEQMLWNRDVSLTWPEGAAGNLAFAGRDILEFDACDAANVGADGRCLVEYERRRLDISATPARGVPVPAHGMFRR